MTPSHFTTADRFSRGVGLDIAAELQSHTDWHRRLRAVIQGDSGEWLDASAVTPPTSCALGRWLGGPGLVSHGHLPAFYAVCTAHREFHAEAGAVLAQAKDGERLKAHRRLVTTFAQRSAELVAALGHLQLGVQAAPELVWEDFTGA